MVKKFSGHTMESHKTRMKDLPDSLSATDDKLSAVNTNYILERRVENSNVQNSFEIKIIIMEAFKIV